jgi:hypothetical protein
MRHINGAQRRWHNPKLRVVPNLPFRVKEHGNRLGVYKYEYGHGKADNY